MRAFVADFIEEYGSTGLASANTSTITFGQLGAFLHLALFQAWSDTICNNKKPLNQFPEDCLIGRYTLPVIYYVTGWMLYSASKSSTTAGDKRPLYFRFASLHTIDESVANTMNLPTSLMELMERRKQRASVFFTREYFDFVCLIEIAMPTEDNRAFPSLHPWHKKATPLFVFSIIFMATPLALPRCSREGS